MSTDTLDSNLCRLLYTSRLVQSESDPAEPTTIAEESARRNTMQGITGSLLFVDGQFIQLLEGPTDRVEETFERICRDFRHRDVQLIDMVGARDRLFPEWGMVCIGKSEQVRIAMREEIEDVRFLAGVNASQAAKQMRALLDEELAIVEQGPSCARSPSSSQSPLP